jgi:hypothetical protein
MILYSTILWPYLLVLYLYWDVFVLYLNLIEFNVKSEGPFCHTRFSGDHIDANVTENLGALALCSGLRAL